MVRKESNVRELVHVVVKSVILVGCALRLDGELDIGATASNNFSHSILRMTGPILSKGIFIQSLLKNATSLKIIWGDRDNKDTRTDLSLVKDVAVTPRLNNILVTSLAALDPFFVSKPGQDRTIYTQTIKHIRTRVVKMKYIHTHVCISIYLSSITLAKFKYFA